MSDVRYLTSRDVAELATMEEYIDAVRDGFRQRGEGAAADQPDLAANAEGTVGLVSYCATLPDQEVFGGYMFTTGPDATDGYYLMGLFDCTNGEPLAVMDGASWNPYKTGAAGAVGVDELAREDASSIGIIGSGAQARGQIRAIAEVRDLETGFVFSPTPENRESFATEMGELLDIDITPTESAEAFVSDVDIVVTATKSSTPVLDGSLLSPGTHVNAVGTGGAANREVDATTVARSKFVPDHKTRGYEDSGEYVQAIEEGAIDKDHLHASLAEVVAGVAPGRESDDEITLFDSSGTGVETTAAAYLLFDRAVSADVGSVVEMTSATSGFAMTGFSKAKSDK